MPRETTIQALESAVPEQVARYQVIAMEKVTKREKREKQIQKVSVEEDILKTVVNELFITVWVTVRIKNSSIIQYQTRSARYTHF